ncbi:hypothetical protein D3C84_877250 [compost metagenome]
MGEHQLRRVGDDGKLLLQILRSQRTQLHQAHGVAVAAQFQHAAGDLAHAPAQAVFEHPVVGQPAATGLELELAAFEDLLQVPLGVEFRLAWRRFAGLAFDQLDRRAVDEEPRIAAADQQPLGDQAVVGLDHGEGADRIGGGEGADRGDLGTGFEGLVLDQLTQPVDDLVDQRGRCVGS